MTTTVAEKAAAESTNTTHFAGQIHQVQTMMLEQLRRDREKASPSHATNCNLNESQGNIIYTLIHKNIQLKKQIQKLSSALYNVRQIQAMDVTNNQTNQFNSNNTHIPDRY